MQHLLLKKRLGCAAPLHLLMGSAPRHLQQDCTPPAVYKLAGQLARGRRRLCSCLGSDKHANRLLHVTLQERLGSLQAGTQALQRVTPGLLT